MLQSGSQRLRAQQHQTSPYIWIEYLLSSSIMHIFISFLLFFIFLIFLDFFFTLLGPACCTSPARTSMGAQTYPGPNRHEDRH